MIYIAVCDDVQLITDKLSEMIKFAKINEFVETKVYTYNSIEDILNAINIIKFNIVFLDIYFDSNQMTGLNVADMIKEKLPDCLIIFISDYNRFYQEMVNHEPFRFLHKPIDNDKVEEVLSLAYKRIKSLDEYYAFKYNRILCVIKIKDVKYVYSEHRKLIIVMSDNKTYTLYKKLDDFEEEIKHRYKYFIRIGKSHLINFLQVRYTSSEYVEFGDGEKVYYSRKYIKDIIKRAYELYEEIQNS